MFRKKDLKSLKKNFDQGSEAEKSIEELEKVFEYLEGLELNNKVEFEFVNGDYHSIDFISG